MKIPAALVRSVLVHLALAGRAFSFALPPDQSLLSLVPPGSQIVAGAVAPLSESHRGHFMLFTRANTIDVEDFFALVGTDASVEIHQLIFAASAGRDGGLPEHSLLVVGHFDTSHIYRSVSTTSIAGSYHKVDLIIVHPFERERAILSDDRLLAIVNSRLAIFGTALSVKEEIDRYLNRTPADRAILRQLSQLRNQDETWCLISSLSLGARIPRALQNLDSAFGDMDRDGETILFGIKYGRKIEFEYVIQAQPYPRANFVPSPPNSEMFTSVSNELFSGPEFRVPLGDRRVVKISKARYEKWLVNLTHY